MIAKTSLGALALLVTALLACHIEDSELPYARVGIVTADSSGTPVPTASACVLLPVLRGSRLEKSFPVASSLSVVVSADREGALVSFENESPSVSDKSISRKQLEDGFFEEVEVFGPGGARFVVQVSSECDPDAGIY